MIFFRKNTKEEAKEFILSIEGVSSTWRYKKYLGLPTLIGRSKVSVFTSIKGRIWDKLNGWREKFLPQAREEVLLKAVIQAIPYTMSVFLLPKILCKDINSMMYKFWCGHKDNGSKMAWMSWEKGRGKRTGWHGLSRP